MVGIIYYVAVQIKSNKAGFVYAEVGDKVTCVTADHINVWIVEDSKGERFPVNPDKLSTAPTTPIAPEIKERKKPESKKPLTQAEKIQLEYLNSIK